MKSILDTLPKGQFPDELLGRILEATQDVFIKAPFEELAKIPKESLNDTVQMVANTMIIGAVLALEYAKERKEKES